MQLLFGLPSDAFFLVLIGYFIAMIYVVVEAHRKWNRNEIRNGSFLLAVLLTIFFPVLGPLMGWMIISDKR